MITIVIANQKGGIGKTTTATAVSSILSNMGFKSLLIDADLQGNSSDTYRAAIEGAPTLYDVILDDDPIPLQEAIQCTDIGDIVASDPLLRNCDEILSADPHGSYRLYNALNKLTTYDFVIIDTAPAMNSLLSNCLIAADYVIIPVTADRYALQGLDHLYQAIHYIQTNQNKGLKILGLLLVKFNERTNLAKEVKLSLSEISLKLGTKLFSTTIHESIKAREAQSLRQSIIDYSPKSKTSLDYIQFVKEVLKEVDTHGKK